MVLVTGPGAQGSLPDHIAELLASWFLSNTVARAEIARLITELRTPGDPVAESIKAAAPWISDLATYERRGYAVFLFIRWEKLRCMVSIQAVPEGYGIPFVE